MTRNDWQVGLIGLLGGIVLTILVGTAYYSSHHKGMGMTDMMRMMGSRNNTSGMNMSMNDMMGYLENKTGDDFDKAFIENMIMHHQGAIEMAEEAKKSAKHDEIKTLSDAIISAQTTEISQMKGWYKSWYNTDVPTNMMGNDSMMGN